MHKYTEKQNRPFSFQNRTFYLSSRKHSVLFTLNKTQTFQKVFCATWMQNHQEISVRFTPNKSTRPWIWFFVF